MSILRNLINKLRYGAAGPPPPPIRWHDGIIIPTTWGVVPESARRQAVINMLADPMKFIGVEQVILRECNGDWEKCKATMRERYPEALPEGY